MNKGRYIVDGKVKRSTIATDIACRQLIGIDVEHIANDPTVRQAFFGKLEPLKKPKSQWDRDYVNYLNGAAATECFNREYLLYLDEVAEYASKAKFRKILIAGIIIVLVIIAGVIVYVFTQGSQEQATDAQDMTAIIEVEPDHTDEEHGEEQADATQETLNI